MTVWYLVFRADSLTCTIAKALSRGGHEVCVWVVEPKHEYGISEGILRNLRETPHVTFVGRDESRLPSVIDRLIIQTHPRPLESTREGAWLAQRAQAITLISAGDRSRPWRSAMGVQSMEARRLWRHFGRIDRIVYKDGFHPRDLLGLFRPRSNLGFDVHSQFLHNAELFGMMHAQDWEAGTRRPILVNFLGCRDPDVRAHVLDAVRPLLRLDNEESSSAVGKPAFWHEYTNASPVGLGPKEFIRILSRSDFTLCPRGYSLVTHRPIEALLRGSVPVLAANELDLYGVDLEDNVNCIGVPEGRWEGSIRRIACVGEDDLVRMRSNIRAMFDQQLNYDAISKRLRRRVGVVDREHQGAQASTQPGGAPAS